MKNYIQIISVLIISAVVMHISASHALSQAPDFNWARHGGGQFADMGNALTVDNNGFVYVTGSFRGNATFGTSTLTSDGENDVFVVKYNASGIVQWALKGGSTGTDEGFGITVDAAGNTYVTGHFTGTATFGTTTLTSVGQFDVFVIKINPAGLILWAIKGGGPTNESGTGIAVDSTGNCYITGGFTGSISFGSSVITSNGFLDVYIAKFNPAGEVQWAIKGGGAEDDFGSGITVDAPGNFYVTGVFSSIAAFGSAALVSSGAYDAFLVKGNGAGIIQWAVKSGGPDEDRGTGVAMDATGNIYVTGQFAGTATFGTQVLNSSGNTDGYLMKCDASGVVQWAKQGGGAGYDRGNAVAVDQTGNVYVAGTFEGNASFGSLTLGSSGALDAYIAKYDASGVVQWINQAGGQNIDTGNGVGTDIYGNCYLTGSFSNSATFGGLTLASNGNMDVFIAKLGNLTGLPEVLSKVSLHPNPFTSSFNIILPGTMCAEATLTDMLGRQVHRQLLMPDSENEIFNIDPPANLQPGLYIIKLVQGAITRQQRVSRL